jgi:7-cyano-7-deazaguanine reductase
MTNIHDSALGKSVAYPTAYDAELLHPISRAAARSALGLGDELPFHGFDLWNAYELSWLDARGKPKVALAEFRVPANSPNLIESKSLKLYLAGHHQARYDNTEALRSLLAHDLSAAAGAPVSAVITPVGSAHAAQIEPLQGEPIDDLPIAIEHYGPPEASLLACDPGVKAEETLVSHLLKSNCPVTGQPDWASVQIAYRGARIDRGGLLRYLASFRTHADFHEACVERVFMDVMHACTPQRLAVYARYTRRGGLDINPYRATPNGGPVPGNPRTARQ